METVLAALVGAVASIAVVVLGQRVNRRLGIPTDLDARLMDELKDLNSALEKNNQRLTDEVKAREVSAATCEAELAVQRDERVKERERFDRQIDSLQRQIIRLQLQISNGDTK